MLSLTSQGRPLVLESAYGEHSDVRSWRTGVIQATGGGFPPSQTFGALKVNDCLASKAANVCVDDYRLLLQTMRNSLRAPQSHARQALNYCWSVDCFYNAIPLPHDRCVQLCPKGIRR